MYKKDSCGDGSKVDVIEQQQYNFFIQQNTNLTQQI